MSKPRSDHQQVEQLSYRYKSLVEIAKLMVPHRDLAELFRVLQQAMRGFQGVTGSFDCAGASQLPTDERS